MSYFLTEDQKLIVNSVQEFCMSPTTQKLVAEAAEKKEFPYECWKAAADQGYIGSYIPEEYGGLGYDMTTYFLIIEELTKHNYPICGALAGHHLGVLAMLAWGTEEQKQKWLVPCATGEKIACGSVTDPAGLANFPQWGFEETKTETGWKLNGTKVLTTNAIAADIQVIFGRPSEGKSWFDHVYIVEKGTPGVETGDQEHKLVPVPTDDWGSIVLRDVEIPAMNRIDDNGSGTTWLGPSYLLLSVQAMVMGYAAFQLSFAFTTQRERYGRPLVALQAVSHKLANMAIRNESGRSLIYNAVRLWEEGRGEECLRLASMAKAYVCESATESLHDAVILHGGIGYTVPVMVGPLWASSIQLELAEMPGDVHRDFIMQSYGVEPGWKNGQA